VTLFDPYDKRIAFDIGKSTTYEGVFPDGELPKELRVGSLLFDGIRVIRPKFSPSQTSIINVACPVDHLTVRHIEVVHSPEAEKAGNLINVRKGGNIRRLILHQIDAEPLEQVVKIDEGGKSPRSRNADFLKNTKHTTAAVLSFAGQSRFFWEAAFIVYPAG